MLTPLGALGEQRTESPFFSRIILHIALPEKLIDIIGNYDYKFGGNSRTKVKQHS
jgi:hypothetical protein